MNDFSAAISLLMSADNDLLMIVRLSLRVSLVAVLFATLIGMPLGAATALYKFPGRKSLVVFAVICNLNSKPHYNIALNIALRSRRIDQHILSSSIQHCINRTASSAPPIGEPRPKYTHPGMQPSIGGRS